MEVHRESAESGQIRAIRLIATDLDGTLLRPDGTVSQRTSAILQRVHEAGISTVLVSGRPPRVLPTIARAAGIGGLALCCNGAVVYDLDQDRILSNITIMPAQIRWLIATLRAALPELHFAVEDGLNITCEPGYAACRPGIANWQPRIANLLLDYGDPVVKLMALHPDSAPEEIHERITGLLGAAYSVTHSGGPFLEIATASVNKAAALARLCKQLNINAHEVIAFGDMPNDLPMLRWAGRSVAVANAHPLVLEIAGETTLSNAEDGVALVLERLLDSSI